jgi:hypothetical protein
MATVRSAGSFNRGSWEMNLFIVDHNTIRVGDVVERFGGIFHSPSPLRQLNTAFIRPCLHLLYTLMNTNSLPFAHSFAI